MFRNTKALFQPRSRYPMRNPSPPKIKGLYNLFVSLQQDVKTAPSASERKEKLQAFTQAKQTLSHHQRSALKRHAWYLYIHKMRSQLVRQEQARISRNDQKSIEQFKLFRRRVLDYRRKKRILSINNIIENEKYNDIVGMEKARTTRERKQRRLNQLSIDETRRISGLKRMAVESATFVTPENIDAHIARELNPSKLLMNTVFEGVRGVNDEVEYDLKLEEYYMNDMKRVNAAREFRDPLYPDARIYPWGAPINTNVDYIGPYEKPTEAQAEALKENKRGGRFDPFAVRKSIDVDQNKNLDPLVDILYGNKGGEERKTSQSTERISREAQIEREDPHLGIYHEDVNTPEEMRKDMKQHYPFLEVHNKSVRRSKEVVEREELLEKYKDRLEAADAAERPAAPKNNESWGRGALATPKEQSQREKKDSEDVSELLDDLFNDLDKQNDKKA